MLDSFASRHLLVAIVLCACSYITVGCAATSDVVPTAKNTATQNSKTKVYRASGIQLTVPADWSCKENKCTPPARLGQGTCLLMDELADDSLEAVYNTTRFSFLRADMTVERPVSVQTKGKWRMLEAVWSRPNEPIETLVSGREVSENGVTVAALCAGVPRPDEETCVDILDSLAIGAAGAGHGKVYQRGAWGIRAAHVRSVETQGKAAGLYDTFELHKPGSATVLTLVVATGHTVESLFHLFNQVKSSAMTPPKIDPERAGIFQAVWTMKGDERLIDLRLFQRGRHRFGTMCVLHGRGATANRALLKQITSTVRPAVR